MLIQLAPPPLSKARHNRANAIEKNLETNAKATDSLELDVVVDIGSYSMTLGRLGGPSSTARSGKKDSIDVGLRLVSSPACTPVPAALPVPLPLRVSVEEGSGFSTLEKRKKEKIQEYYLSSSSSPSTASPSSPSSSFERCGTETDLSSPDTPYPNVARNDAAINTNTNIVGNTQVRKRSSFFGWEFAWDQEALERADDAGKLRSAVGIGGSPVRRKSDLNPSSSKKIPIVDQESFTDLDEDVDADEDAVLQKTPTRNTTRSYSHSPQSHRHSTCSSPNQQRHGHEAATSGSHCSSINERCITTNTITNSSQKLSPSLTRRGLSLKRSFKMGSTVGRTLGPRLTLSSAELGFGSDSNSGPFPTSNSPDKSIRRCESEGFGLREEEEKRECEEKGKKAGKENDEDVDVEKEKEKESEMRSLGAARPVPASYARATATATILTPATGTDIGVNIGGGCGFASRPGGGSNPVKYKTMSKSMLNSRPSLPTMKTTTTVSSPVCSAITEQYQQQQDGHNSVFSTAVRKPHPFIDWFRSLETSTSRGDADAEQEMKIIRRSGRGNDNESLSSLPLLPPLPPLLPPSMTPPPQPQPQSQSLPTPTKSTLLGKPSISSFKKRPVPPALPPLPGSSEWAHHSMLTTNGVSGAAVSVVSLAHSRTRSVSRTSSQPPSRPTTPKPSMRLSAMNMGTVRNAFAGVGAKVSARMSINSASTRSSAGATASNTVASSVGGMGMGMGIGMDDIDGDFMDLRDPFASPPPSKLVSVFRGGDHTGGGSDFWVSERAMSSLGGGAGVQYDDDDSVEVGITRRISSISGGKRRVNMNAWGRLPIPSTLPLPGTIPETSNGGDSSEVANMKKAHSHHGERRKHKKEKRPRKVDAGVLVEMNSSSLHGYSAPCSAGEEDADFGVEEAILSQRLLRRLDSVSFEWD